MENIKASLVKADFSITISVQSWLTEKSKSKQQRANERIEGILREKYSQTVEELKILQKLPFFDEHSIYFAIAEKLEYFAENIQFRLMEEKKLSKLKEDLNRFDKNKPTRIDYIKNNCDTIYDSWDDLTFDQSKIKIQPRKGFYPSIRLGGSLKILNNIKSSYFLRLYRNEMYKLRFTNGVINRPVSPGLDRIKEIIQHRILELQSNSTFGGIWFNLKGRGRSGILDLVNSGQLMNEFLPIPAKLLNEDDTVLALVENNNNILEEILLFIFNRGDSCFVLWEILIATELDTYSYCIKRVLNLK